MKQTRSEKQWSGIRLERTFLYGEEIGPDARQQEHKNWVKPWDDARTKKQDEKLGKRNSAEGNQ
jgi:hypothetical protein